MTNAWWFAGWLVASIVLGLETRARRQLLREADERASAAELTREAEALRRTGEERIRIARELHDSLAHPISVINVQAAAGLHLMDKQPEQARTALTAILAASKEALSELRATLGVLRQVDEADDAPLRPGIQHIATVIESARSTGLNIELSAEGLPRELPSGIDLAAYRIVQESLTNAIRHARAATVRVAIHYLSDELRIEVEDDGAGPALPQAESASGQGLAGIRERVMQVGGHLDAGPLARGGFYVHASLPLNPSP